MTETTSTTAPQRTNRRKKVAAATGVLVVGGSAAFAFWTAGGTGTGTAGTGDVEGVTVNQTSVVSNLAPGSGTQALSGDFDNGNDAAVGVTTVTGDVTTDPAVGCDADWYDVDGVGTVTGNTVPAGDDEGAWSGLTIELLNDPAVNQNACKNATVTIVYTAG